MCTLLKGETFKFGFNAQYAQLQQRVCVADMLDGRSNTISPVSFRTYTIILN